MFEISGMIRNHQQVKKGLLYSIFAEYFHNNFVFIKIVYTGKDNYVIILNKITKIP